MNDISDIIIRNNKRYIGGKHNGRDNEGYDDR